MYQVRAQVFLVEQNGTFQERDDIDKQAIHVFGWRPAARCGSLSSSSSPEQDDFKEDDLVAYCRVFLKIAEVLGEKQTVISLGRVLVVKAARGRGLMSELVDSFVLQELFADEKAIQLRFEERENAVSYWGISAQQYLEGAYEKFGFKTHGEPFLSSKGTGIVHVNMLRKVGQ